MTIPVLEAMAATLVAQRVPSGLNEVVRLHSGYMNAAEWTPFTAIIATLRLLLPDPVVLADIRCIQGALNLTVQQCQSAGLQQSALLDGQASRSIFYPILQKLYEAYALSWNAKRSRMNQVFQKATSKSLFAIYDTDDAFLSLERLYDRQATRINLIQAVVDASRPPSRAPGGQPRATGGRPNPAPRRQPGDQDKTRGMFKELKAAYTDVVGDTQDHCFMCTFLCHAGPFNGDFKALKAWRDSAVDLAALQPHLGRKCGTAMPGSTAHTQPKQLPSRDKLKLLFPKWRDIANKQS